MKYLIAPIGILLAIYLGNVLGIYSLCVDSPRLYKAKKYVFLIPLFLVCYSLYTIFLTDSEQRKSSIRFLMTPHKCTIVTYFFAEVIAIEREKVPKKTPQKIDVINSVFNLFRNNPWLHYKWQI